MGKLRKEVVVVPRRKPRQALRVMGKIYIMNHGHRWYFCLEGKKTIGGDEHVDFILSQKLGDRKFEPNIP